MARACIDVFKQHGAIIPPITGEGNNGFFKVWRDNKLQSIAPEYGPEQGAAGIRAAVALLEGKSLYKRYVYNPLPITIENRDKFLRDDLADEYWFPSALSEEKRKAITL
jgi:ribose transport system substrate-binding protein